MAKADSSGSLARNLSVPSLEKLDMDTDDNAVSTLLGPDGTPRVGAPAAEAAGEQLEQLKRLRATPTLPPAALQVEGALEF